MIAGPNLGRESLRSCEKERCGWVVDLWKQWKLGSLDESNECRLERWIELR
jgi:hypothetical protein